MKFTSDIGESKEEWLSRNAVNCPFHPKVPWDHGIIWDCPSHPTAPWDIPWNVHLSLYRCMRVLLSIPSHGPMGPWDIPQDVHLSLSLTHEYLTVHPIPQSHGSVK